jgi:hypothetical protein
MANNMGGTMRAMVTLYFSIDAQYVTGSKRGMTTTAIPRWKG